jgi:phosphoglycolate phosphatase-like HAD superfamily hydrolase
MEGFALLFDFDGTLADSLPLCLAALRASLLRHTGRIHSDQEIAANFGASEEGIFQRMAPDVWRECLASYVEEYERSHHLCPAAFDGVKALLTGLRGRGVRLGLVTGKGAGTAAVSLRLLGLAELFDQVRTGSPRGDVKAAHIAELVHHFGVSPERTAYVGDFTADVRAAREAGVWALAAAWAPGASAEALAAERPDALLRSTEDLEWWVERWLSGGSRSRIARQG